MLEIHVFDDVILKDSLEEALAVIVDVVTKWFNSDEKEPINIILKKIDNKAPPALEISVRDALITKGVLV